jgi:negative regulator of sigma E activity
VGRKAVLAVAAAVVLVVLVGVAVAATRGHATKRPQPAKTRSSQQFGDDADLMRRLERSKHVDGTK